MTPKDIRLNKKGNKDCLRFLYLDDHPIMHKAIRGILVDHFPGSECMECCTTQQALEMVEQQEPDFVIADLNLEGTNCYSFIQTLHKKHAHLPILVFSMYEDVDSINQALKAGANGYITKKDPPEHIILAIRSLRQNRRYLSDRASSALVHYIQEPDREQAVQVTEKLSPREREIFQLLGNELSRKEIASQLHISVPTIDTHIERIKIKLGFESSFKLLCFALKYVLQRNEKS